MRSDNSRLENPWLFCRQCDFQVYEFPTVWHKMAAYCRVTFRVASWPQSIGQCVLEAIGLRCFQHPTISHYVTMHCSVTTLVTDLCFAITKKKPKQLTTTHEGLAFHSYWFTVWWDENTIAMSCLILLPAGELPVCNGKVLCVCSCVRVWNFKTGRFKADGRRPILPSCFHSVVHNTALRCNRHFPSHSNL